jgi:hypothetical protein
MTVDSARRATLSVDPGEQVKIGRRCNALQLGQVAPETFQAPDRDHSHPDRMMPAPATKVARA